MVQDSNILDINLHKLSFSDIANYKYYTDGSVYVTTALS